MITAGDSTKASMCALKAFYNGFLNHIVLDEVPKEHQS